MADPRQVLTLLQDSRDLVALGWGTANDNVEWEDASGPFCPSIALYSSGDGISEVILAAHIALLQAAGRPVPTTHEEILAAVYQWNDAQMSVYPVLGTFTGAIVALEATLSRELVAA